MKGARKGFKTGMGARRRLLRGLPREAVRELERAAQAPSGAIPEDHPGPEARCLGVYCDQFEPCRCR